MIESKLQNEPRNFELYGFEMRDHGTIRFFPDAERTNEILSLENEAGKKCEITATNWGYYLGPSLNSRLLTNGYRAALMINQNDQVYLVAVDTSKLQQFESYMHAQENSRLLCWIDEWLKRPN